MSNSNEYGEDILQELRKQTKWIKFLALSKLKKIIGGTLTTKELRRIYDLSDGENSTYDIAKKMSEEEMKVSHMKIYRYWKKWSTLGMVVPNEKYSGRYKKIIDLEDLGIGG